MKEYQTIRQEGREEFIERKSRFIGWSKPVKTEEEAIAFINQIRSEHWDATHNVYAYSLRDGQLARYSDDGEPQGTAGVPTLEVLTRSGVTDTVLVTTRYFGGILLGTGGLVRAYSHAASLALAAGGVVKMQVCKQAILLCEYHQYGSVARILPNFGAVIDDTIYGQDVEVQFHIPPEKLPALCVRLADETSGSVEPEVLGEQFYPMEIEES